MITYACFVAKNQVKVIQAKRWFHVGCKALYVQYSRHPFKSIESLLYLVHTIGKLNAILLALRASKSLNIWCLFSFHISKIKIVHTESVQYVIHSQLNKTVHLHITTNSTNNHLIAKWFFSYNQYDFEPISSSVFAVHQIPAIIKML